ncbi:uncharacterized protein LOC134945659 isoform X1 [Pseudophryne corroboree]|uniref:uncharacterized protein LOC134945659 isoform X1 n=1 Tax=Pseudophryne corroboree TaxID=495146 RepID=UPI003081B975
MDVDVMRPYVQEFRLDNCARGNQGYNRVLLQLFGYTGHGKSSFINSCKYVVDDGLYQEYAKVAGSEDKPETMKRNSYKLTENITLVDNRGCATMNKYETGAIYAQLGNFLPLDTEVKWNHNFEDMLKITLDSESQDTDSDFIVPVFIYSADKGMTDNEMDELKDFLEKARDITGLFPTVVLTRKLSRNLPLVQDKFRKLGVENMFSIENYTAEDHRKTRRKHEDIAKCLYEIIKDVEFKLKEERNPAAEKRKRREIICVFAHQRAMEREKVHAITAAALWAMQREREIERENKVCILL